MRRMTILLALLIGAALVPANNAVGDNAALASLVLDAPLPPWADTVPHTVLHSSPVIVELDGDAGPEMVVATRDGWLYVIDTAGNSLSVKPGWPVQLNAHIGSSPAVGDLDNDGVPEIVIGVGDASDVGTDRKGGIAVFEPDGSRRFFKETPPFGPTGEQGVFSTPTLGDLNNDGFPDIVAASFNRNIYALDRHGADLPGWPHPTVDTTWASPSLVDIENDGFPSVVIGSDFGWQGTPALGCTSPPTQGLIMVIETDGRMRSGWPKCMGVPIWSSPAIVDLNNDGVPVAVFGTNNYLSGNRGSGLDKVYAIRLTDGGDVPGWPVTLRHGPFEQTMSSPAIADVDSDGKYEIAIGSAWGARADFSDRGSLYLINSDGGIRWEAQYPNPVLASPSVGDVTGDEKPDVLVGTGDWATYGYDAGGNQVFFFKSESFVFNSPALGDINGDRTTEVVVASGVQQDVPKLYVVGSPGSADVDVNPWPVFRHDPPRLGRAPVPQYNFDEFILLANPSAQPARATLSLQLAEGPPLELVKEVPPNTRVTIPIDETVADKEVSVKVTSDIAITAERAVYFAYGGSRWKGGHVKHGAPAPATSWFLAEGYTASNFDTFLLVQNPGSTDVVANITLLKPGGAGTQQVALAVPAQSRRTLNVKDVPGFDASEVSLAVQATGPVVVERSMYFDYNGLQGGHVGLGVTEAAEEWFLAEGYTAGSFDTFVLAANPGTEPADVTYTFLRPSGDPITIQRTIPGGARETVAVDGIPGLESTELSTRVTSTQPIAVERAMYFDSSGRTDGHNAEGVADLSPSWFFAEGFTGPNFDEYLLFANPGSAPVDVDLDFLLEDGSVREHSVGIPGLSRQTVHVNDVVPGVGHSTAVTVRGGTGIAVERAMYFIYSDSWDGGHDSKGVAELSKTWYFAEGYTGP